MAGMEGFTRLAGRSKAQVSTVKLGADSVNQGLRYKGIFDLNEVYRIIYDWLVSKGFQVQESKYRSIVLPHGAKELSFDWNAHKKGNEFVMVHMMIHFQIEDLQEIEVLKDGEKKKLVKGILFIRVTQDLEYDFSEQFAYSKMHQTIVRFLADFMWAKKIETYWEDKARFKSYELVNVIKETLDFMTKGNEHYDVW